MRNFIYFTFIVFLLNSCSKEDKADVANSTTPAKLTVYKNQTSDITNDALQAQYIGTNSEYTLNFYGTYSGNNLPQELSTVTYQKKGNDTIVNLILEPFTKRITSSVISVNGVKSPIVMKYDYFADNSNAVAVSFYNYDWISNNSELLHTCKMENSNGTNTLSPIFANRNINDGGDIFVGAAAGFAFAEIVVATVGGPNAFSLLPLVSTVATSILASATATAIITGVAIGVAIIALSAILSPAHANELNPLDLPYPPGTGLNPILPNSNPLPHLQTSSCINTDISFHATMDGFGSIMFWGVNGGQAPYRYIVNSSSQQNEVFGNNYPDGSYVVGVKDANGCVSVKNIHLTRDLESPKWYVGTYTLNSTSADPPYPLDGQSGQIYIYDYGQDGNFQFIAYVKSIVPGIPNFYSKGLGSPIESQYSSFSWSSQGYPDMVFTICMNRVNGVSMTTANTGIYPYTTSRVVQFNGIDPFYYYVNLQADFNIQSPPVGLTQANMNQINAMIASEEYSLTINE